MDRIALIRDPPFVRIVDGRPPVPTRYACSLVPALNNGEYGECELYDITHANSGHSKKYGYDFTDGNSDRDVKSQNV